MAIKREQKTETQGINLWTEKLHLAKNSRIKSKCAIVQCFVERRKECVWQQTLYVYVLYVGIYSLEIRWTTTLLEPDRVCTSTKQAAANSRLYGGKKRKSLKRIPMLASCMQS